MSKKKKYNLFVSIGFPPKAVCIQHTGQTHLNALPNIPLVSKDHTLKPTEHLSLCIAGRRQWQD